MKKKYKFDDYEIRILILALNELRNQLIREERYTDAVDELILKLYGYRLLYINIIGRGSIKNTSFEIIVSNK